MSIALASTALSLAAPSNAFGQPSTEDPAAHFERGLKFFKEGNYGAAMAQFKRCYELDPNASVLYNIGQTARQLNLYSEALVALERFMREVKDIDEPTRTNVQGWIAELKESVAVVTVKTNVEGVDIAVDDVDYGKTPLKEPIYMNAGKRRISATKSGYAPVTRIVEVAGTEQKTFDLELVSLTSDPNPDPNPKNPSEVEHTPWPWVGLGVTAGFGVATAVVGGLSFGKKADFEDALARFPGSQTEIDDARSTAKTFAITADVLGGVTGGLAALTIIAFIVDYTRSPAAPEASPSSTEAAPPATSLMPLIAPGFVGLFGTF